MVPERWATPTRLPKLALLFLVLKLLRQLWPFVLLWGMRLVFQDGTAAGQSKANTTSWFILGGVAVFVLVQLNEVLRWIFFRFQILEGEFIVQSGWLSRKRTVISLSRIQAVHQHQHLLHRITGSCKLQIDTAGSDDEEIELEAISLADAASLHALLHPPIAGNLAVDFAGIDDRATVDTSTRAPTSSDEQLSMTTADLIRLSISENHLQTLLLVLLFIFGKMQDVKDYLGIDTVEWVAEQSDSVQLGLQAAALLVAVGLGITLVVSFVRVFLRFGGFKVWFKDAALHIEWGLLETRKKLVSKERMQQITWKSNWLRQRLNLFVVRIHVFSEPTLKEELLLRVPLSSIEAWQRLLNYYVDVQDESPLRNYQPDVRWWIRRSFVFALPLFLVLAGVLFWLAPWWTAFFPMLVWGYLVVAWKVWHKRFQGQLFKGALRVKKGVWGNNGVLVRLEHVQSVGLHSSPYMRSRGLASVKFRVAGGSPIVVPYLQEAEAVALIDYVVGFIEARR